MKLIYVVRLESWAILLGLLVPAFLPNHLWAGVADCGAVRDGAAKVVSFATKGSDGQALRVPGVLVIPHGSGPFPAMVVLNGSGGIRPPRCYDWLMVRFQHLGYAALLIDSATPRLEGGLGGYGFEDQAQDAYKGKALLASLPFVNAKRIGVAGISKGGAAVLSAVSRPGFLRTPQVPPFRAAVAYYPLCFRELGTLETPLLILVGSADAVAPAAHCRRLKIVHGGQPDLVVCVFPGARHLFDVPGHPNYNEAAEQNAHAALESFLAKHL